MKKILVSLLVAAMVGATLTGCGSKAEGNGTQVEQGSSVSAADIVEQLKEYMPMPMEPTEEEAKDIYHLNLDDVEDYGILETQISPGPGFIMVVKAKDGKVDAVKASVEQVLQDKIGSAFYPEEQEVAENAKVEVNGNLVSLFIVNSQVSADAEAKYAELIK